MFKYELLKKDYVIETLGKGVPVIICDFSTMRMIDARTATVQAIQALIEKDSTVAYKKVEVSE